MQLVIPIHKYPNLSLYSTQKILQHGRLAAAGAIPRDPMKESVSLQLDFMNIL